MTPSDIVRRRLRNQGISDPMAGGPGDVVRWLVGVQAQDWAGAKWALGLRLRGATEQDVERAFNVGAILRTHVLRPTWHFVTPADIRWMLALTAPRIHAVQGYRYRQLELGAATFKRSNKALLEALNGGGHRTRDELRSVLERAGVATDGQRMAYLLGRAELDGVVCSGPRRGKQFTYALLDERAPRARILDRDEALAELARRYFASRGPATVHDFAKWSGLTVADARNGLEAVEAGLRHEDVEGKTHWFSTSRRTKRERSPTAHLLSIYDEYVSGYRDRSAMIDERHAARLTGMGNALSYIVVLDGRIVGTWKRTLGTTEVAIRIDMFRRSSRAGKDAIAAAASRYGEFLGRSAVLAV